MFLKLIVLLLSLTLLVVSAEPNKEEVLIVLEGVLVGALNTEFPNVETCISDILKDVGEDIITAIKSIDEEEDSVKDSLELIGVSFVTLADNIVDDCGLAIEELQTLRTIGANFADPVTFAYHVGKDLIVNGVSIYNDVETAIQDYQGEEWYDMGVQVGSAVSLAILGANAPLVNDLKLE